MQLLYIHHIALQTIAVHWISFVSLTGLCFTLLYQLTPSRS